MRGTKRCSRCGVVKDLDGFHRHAGRRDGRQTFCKLCKSRYTRQWYAENQDEHRASVTVHRTAARDTARARIDELKDQPCTDCGGRFPPEAMDFDHVSGNKVADIGALVERSLAALLAEIAKCELVCANCHRLRTARRAGR